MQECCADFPFPERECENSEFDAFWPLALCGLEWLGHMWDIFFAIAILIGLLTWCAILNEQDQELHYKKVKEEPDGKEPDIEAPKQVDRRVTIQKEIDELRKSICEVDEEIALVDRAVDGVRNPMRDKSCALLYFIRLRKLVNSKRRGILRVRLRHAAGLPAGDSNGLSDPYVVVETGKEGRQAEYKPMTMQSQTISKTLDPTWDETLEFMGTLSDFAASGLRLKVYDEDLLTSDDFLGEAVCSLKPLPISPTQQLSKSLHLSKQVCVRVPMTVPLVRVRVSCLCRGRARSRHLSSLSLALLAPFASSASSALSLSLSLSLLLKRARF